MSRVCTTLCREGFQFYVAQDYHFLAAFSWAYAAAARKAGADTGNRHATVLRQLQEGIAEEMLLHSAYAKVRRTTAASRRNVLSHDAHQ